MRRLWTVLAALATLSLTNCGYNAIQTNDEQVKSSWSEVLNQYQRRADLVPNLVNSVKGFAQQEKDVLLGVTNARAKVGSIQATPELINDPGAFAKFQAAQGELTSALSKLLVVTENYPQLKSDALFRDLMAQLEGTENRITVARNRYIKTVQDYNVTIRIVSDQPDGDGVRIQTEGELRRRERKGNLHCAESGFQPAGDRPRQVVRPPGSHQRCRQCWRPSEPLHGLGHDERCKSLNSGAAGMLGLRRLGGCRGAAPHRAGGRPDRDAQRG